MTADNRERLHWSPYAPKGPIDSPIRSVNELNECLLSSANLAFMDRANSVRQLRCSLAGLFWWAKREFIKIRSNNHRHRLWLTVKLELRKSMQF